MLTQRRHPLCRRFRSMISPLVDNYRVETGNTPCCAPPLLFPTCVTRKRRREGTILVFFWGGRNFREVLNKRCFNFQMRNLIYRGGLFIKKPPTTQRGGRNLLCLAKTINRSIRFIYRYHHETFRDPPSNMKSFCYFVPIIITNFL